MLKKDRQVNPAWLETEVAILKTCRHPNIVFLREVLGAIGDERFFLVMELARGGSLLARIEAENGLPESYAASVTIQIASALAYLHAQGIVHRDMKPENCLLLEMSSRSLVKLCDVSIAPAARSLPPHAPPARRRMPRSLNAQPRVGECPRSERPRRPCECICVGVVRTLVQFGLSKMLETPSPDGALTATPTSAPDAGPGRAAVMQSRVGSHFYASPELLRDEPYDASIDLWGLGHILFMCVTGIHAFENSVDMCTRPPPPPRRPGARTRRWVCTLKRGVYACVCTLKKRPSTACPEAAACRTCGEGRKRGRADSLAAAPCAHGQRAPALGVCAHPTPQRPLRSSRPYPPLSDRHRRRCRRLQTTT